MIGNNAIMDSRYEFACSNWNACYNNNISLNAGTFNNHTCHGSPAITTFVFSEAIDRGAIASGSRI